MEETRTPVHGRPLRTRSIAAAVTTVRSNPTTLSAIQKQSIVGATRNAVSATVSSLASAPTSRGVMSKEASVDDEEVATLRLIIHEREEQVALLEEILSEKQLLIRHDDMLEERIHQYEEDLGKLASIVNVDAPDTPASERSGTSSKRGKGADVVSLGTTVKKKMHSIHAIIDGVHKLRYDKQRMEIDLAKNERTLQALQSEMMKLQEDTKVGELPVKNNSTITTADLVSKTLTSTEEAGTEATGDPKSKCDLERELLEMQQKHISMKKKLSCYQTEYHAARQNLRLREMELLEFQRKHRDSTTCDRGRQDQPIDFQCWKNVENVVPTSYRHFFHGAEWVQLVENRPEAMRAGILKAVSLALCAPHGFVSIPELQHGPDMVVIVEIVVQHPVAIRQKQIELLLMDCPFTEVKGLLQRRNDPKDGWDLVQEQLHGTRSTLVNKEEEMLLLQHKLQGLESSLEEEIKQHDADERLIHEVLDETEETLKTMFAEIKKRKVKEEQLEEQLQKLTETLEEREETIKKLTVKLEECNTGMKQQQEDYAQALEEVQRKMSEDLRNVETMHRQEVQVLLKQQEQLTIKTKAKPSMVSHTLVVKWSEKGEGTPLLLDSNNKDILGTLVVGAIAAAMAGAAPTAITAIPSKLLSLMCTDCEIRAEVQLQLYSTANNDAERVAGEIRRCRAPSVVLFLQEWREMNYMMERRTCEIQRLTQALKTAAEEVEQVKLQLHRQCEQTRLTEERHAVAVRGLSHIGTAVSVEGGSPGDIAVAVAVLVARLAEVQTTKPEEEKEWHQQEKDQANKQLEYQREREELRGALRESKCDVENTIAELSALRTTHQRLLRENAVRLKARDVLRAQLTELQKSRQVGLLKHTENVNKDEDIASTLVSLLRSSYVAYDEVLEQQESSKKQWIALENSLRGLLQSSESEIARLRLQCTELENELAKKTITDASCIANCEQSEAEYHKLLNCIKAEKEVLSARVVELTQQCRTLERDQGKLQSEMMCRSERAEDLMKQLVHEEDMRRELEEELKRLRRGKTTISAVTTSSSSRANAVEIRRLRNFCLHTLKIPLTNKEQSVGGIVVCMEQHYGSVQEEKEQFSAALLSIHTVTRLLKECISTTEEHEENLIRRTRSATVHKAVGNSHTPVRATVNGGSAVLRGFGRSLSYNSGLPPPSLSARTPRSGGRMSATPLSLARTASRQYHLQQQTEQKEQHAGVVEAPPKQEALGVRSQELASSAAEVVYLAQLLVSVVTYWREKERQHNTRFRDASKKCRDLCVELSRTEHALTGHQQEKEKEEHIGRKTGVRTACDEQDESFLRRSRAHALCVVLSVKDHLHDTLAALQPAAAAIRDDMAAQTTPTRPRCTTDITHDIRMAEESVGYALKRIINAAGAIFSSHERSDIEGKRGEEYFTMPEMCRGTISPRTPTERKQHEGLLPRGANISPSSPMRKQRSVSSGMTGLDYRQYTGRDDQQVIQQALREARRRKR